MEKNKSLSIVVPSFNQGRFLQQNLDACIPLRSRGLELLVLDGGSSDNTHALLESHSADIDYWRSRRDDGQAAAINEGFALCTGKWLAFQNSDDYYLHEPLAHVLDLLESDAADKWDILVGGTRFVDEAGRHLVDHFPKPLNRLMLAQRNYINNQSLFVRTEFARDAGFLDPKLTFCLDYEWFLRLFAKRPRVKLLQQIVGVQRFHPATKTSTLSAVHGNERRAILAANFSRTELMLSSACDLPYRFARWLYGAVV